MRLHLPLPFVGSPIALGELIGTTSGAWITHPPTRCPNGHDFGAGRMLVGYQACLGHGGGAHHLDLPRARYTVYGPAPEHALHGTRRARRGANLHD